MADENKSRLLPAILTFVVVAAVVIVAGRIATWALRTIVLPVVAVLLAWGAARFVYKARD
jgi:hypothetical protein